MEGIGSKSKRSYLPIVLISLVGFIIFLVLSLLCIIIFLNTLTSQGKKTREKTFDYQILELNREKNETLSSGIISIPHPYHHGEYDFLSYTNEEGGLVLISNIEDDEYRCIGSCTCEKKGGFYNSKKKENITPRPLNSLVLLVPSTTTSGAISVSKKKYLEMCKEVYGKKCEGYNIQVKVDSCDLVISEFEQLMKEEPKKVFWCKGTCVENMLFQEIESDIKLRDYKLLREKKEYSRNCNDFVLEGTEIVLGERIEELQSTPKERAKEKFMTGQLQMFCRMNSIKPIDVGWENKKAVRKRKKNYRKESIKDNLCVGHMYSENPSVWCKRIVGGTRRRWREK